MSTHQPTALPALLSQALDDRHISLGFAAEAHGDATADELASRLRGESPMRLDRDQRRELVAYLAGEGMSTRAIAPIVGASKDTVHRDLATVSGETVDRPSMVTSLDGRSPSTEGHRWAPVANATPAPTLT